MNATPADWFRTRPTPPQVNAHRTDTGEWVLLYRIQGGFTNRYAAYQAAEKAQREIAAIIESTRQEEISDAGPFDAHTDWTRDAERRGDVERAQLIRDNR